MESNILDVETLERVFTVSRDKVSPLKYQLSLRGSTGLKLNAILGQVTIQLSFLQEHSTVNGELELHKWANSTINFLVADSSVQLKRVILCMPFMRQHRVSLHFAPRPRISAVITDTPGGDKRRVRLKIKCSEVKLHLCKPVNSGDETAAFSMSNLFVANDYVLTLCNNTELQLPSRLIFSDYLQNDCDDSLCLQKNIILPVKATKKYTNVTLVAKSKEQSIQKTNIVSVHEATTESRSKERPEMRNELKMCDKCHVFKGKCECPILCDICNGMTTRKNICECQQEQVQSLVTKISKSMGEPQQSKTDISEEQCGQIDYIPDSQQSGVSDIIDRHFDSLDLRPPEPWRNGGFEPLHK